MHSLSSDGRPQHLVVGGGLAGLVSGLTLARAGRSVTVLEASSELGGRARSQLHEGLVFNLGPHALYENGPGGRALAALGIPLVGGAPALSGSLALLRGALFRLPAGPWSILGARELSFAERLELGRVFAAASAARPEALIGQALSAWIAQRCKRPGSRAYAEAFFRLTTYDAAPETACAGAALASLQSAIRDRVLYFDQGWGALVRALAEALTAAGGRIRTAAPVRALTPKGLSLAGGEELPAAGVVLAAPPRVALELIGADRAPGLAAAIAALEPLRMACLDLGLRRSPVPERGFVLGIDRPLYYSNHSLAAKLGEDGEVVHVGRYLRPDEKLDPAAVEAELEAFVDRVQPGWREELCFRRFLPELVVVRDRARADRGGLAGRVAVAVEGHPELALAGDWVGDQGSLADAAILSGLAAARSLLAAAKAPERAA